MINSKLYQLIALFSRDEKKQFQLFLTSPIFNNDVTLTKLYELLLEAMRQKKITLTKKEVYNKLFPKKLFKEQRINNMMTQLYHQAQSFIAHSELKTNRYLNNELALQFLRQKQNKKIFNSSFIDIEKKLAKQKIKDRLYYHCFYKIAEEADSFMVQAGIREKNNQLQKAFDNLELFYIAEKLRLVCEMLSRKNIIGANYSFGATEFILKYVERNLANYSQHPAILIYHCIYYTLIQDENAFHFKRLKKLLKDHTLSFTKEEAKHMYAFAENYCIKKVNTGHTEYLLEIYLIYEQLLASGLMLNNSVLAESDYKNIVAITLRLGKYDWTLDFIEKYKTLLPKQVQQNAYAYNIALYYYTLKEYKNALQALRGVEFTDVFYHLGAKLILLKIYYETEQIDAFYSAIDTFKLYLHRNKKIAVYQRESYANFVRFAKYCFDIKINPPVKSALKPKLDSLMKKIAEKNRTVSLLWLKERIADFSTK